jgi:hypothetical protein
VRLTGDPDGVTALKALAEEHRDYIKFLITEAQSNSDHVAPFKGGDGSQWELKLHLDTGDLEVRKHPNAP